MDTTKKSYIDLEKIIIISLCIIPFLLVLLGIFYVVTLEGVLYRQVRQSIEAVGANSAQLAAERLENTGAKLRSVSYLNDITSKNIELNDKIDILRKEMEKYGWKDMFFANLDGYGKTVTGAAFSIADRAYFSDVIKGKSYTSGILYRENYMKDYIAHAVPVISSKKEIIGALVAVEDAIRPHFSQSKMSNKSLGSNVFFVDNKGHFTEDGKISEQSICQIIAEENNLPRPKVTKEFLFSLSKEKKPIFFRGVESYISVDSIGNTGWMTMGIIPRNTSMKEVDNICFFSIALVIGILIALIVSIFYLLRTGKIYKQYRAFSSALSNAQGIFYLNVDETGLVHYANEFFYTHLEHDEADGQMQLLDYTDDMTAVELKKLLRSGTNFVLNIRPKNAAPFCMQCTRLPQTDKKNLWVFLGTDISSYQNSIEAKHAQSRITEMQQIIDSIPHALIVHTPTGIFLANSRVFTVLNVDKVEDVRESIRRGMSPEVFQQQVDMVRRVFRHGKAESSTFSITIPSGEKYILRNVQSPVFDDDGKVKYAVNVSINITETVNLQEKLENELQRQREILDSSPTGFLYTRQHNIQYCNPTMKEMIDCEIGKPVDYDRIDMSGKMLNIREQVEKGLHLTNVLMTVPDKDGGERYLSVSLSGTKWEGEWHNLAWAHDVTDIQNAQKELIIARDAAEQAARAKSDFLATMSHEIRTPMNAVLGFLHVFEKENLNETQLNYIEKITISAKGLLRIINDILDFSKIEANKMDLENTPLNLRSNIDAVYSIMAFTASEKHLTFQRVIDDNVPNMLMGDGERLTQVLLNLLSNAIKFTSEGSVKLHVSVKEKKSLWEYVLQFSVSDTGIGLSQKQIRQLFKPFTQADTSTSRKFGGTGLGLAISKRLIELMGGSIEVKSEEGRGSNFICTIPMMASHETLMPHGREGEVSINVDYDLQLEAIKGKKVLIAEDNLINQEIATAMLEEFELSLEFADNGQEAVEKAQEKSYDLIFMDLQMPIMNGLEATRKIRELGQSIEFLKDIPIIAMTANVMNEDIKACQEAGMNDHVGKPISPDALRTALITWLAERQ